MHACLQAGKLMRYTQKMFSNYRNQHEPQLSGEETQRGECGSLAPSLRTPLQ